MFRGDAGVDGTADGLIEGAFMIEPLRPTDLLYLSGQKSVGRSIWFRLSRKQLWRDCLARTRKASA